MLYHAEHTNTLIVFILSYLHTKNCWRYNEIVKFNFVARAAKKKFLEPLPYTVKMKIKKKDETREAWHVARM